jgi:hypothetical protein
MIVLCALVYMQCDLPCCVFLLKTLVSTCVIKAIELVLNIIVLEVQLLII